jgi:hypothetical protein
MRNFALQAFMFSYTIASSHVGHVLGGSIFNSNFSLNSTVPVSIFDSCQNLESSVQYYAEVDFRQKPSLVLSKASFCVYKRRVIGFWRLLTWVLFQSYRLSFPPLLKQCGKQNLIISWCNRGPSQSSSPLPWTMHHVSLALCTSAMCYHYIILKCWRAHTHVHVPGTIGMAGQSLRQQKQRTNPTKQKQHAVDDPNKQTQQNIGTECIIKLSRISFSYKGEQSWNLVLFRTSE